MSEYNDEFIEFPKDWEVKRLNELAKIIMGQSPPSSAYNDKGQGMPFIQGSKEFGDIHPSIKTFTTNCKKIAPKDSILFSVRAPVGDINISDREICIGRGIAAIVPYNKTDLLYLYYYLTYSTFKIKRYSSGTTFESIKKRDLENFQIILPPLDERKKIVKILNTLDFIIIDTTNLIGKLKLLKEKTLNLLITGKIWHKEFKDTEIGKIPKNWKVVKLGEIAVDIYRYPTYYNIKYVGMDEGVPEVRAELIKENGELEDDLSKYRFISKETSQRFSKTILHEGDFVLSVRGTLGKVAIVPKFLEGANITANLMKISLNRLKCYPPFFKQFFLSDFFRKNLDNISSQTTIKTIQASKLKSIKIPLPPLEEQKKIAEILSTIDNKIETETKYLDYMKKLKEKLLAALMTGKIRVNSIATGDFR